MHTTSDGGVEGCQSRMKSGGVPKISFYLMLPCNGMSLQYVRRSYSYLELLLSFPSFFIYEMTVETLFNTAPELHLISATEVIHSTAQQSSREQRLQALQFLRYQATAHGDIEAKTKLCTIYSQSSHAMAANEREADMWAQSVFDKQLSDALTSCAEYLAHHEPLSDNTVDVILQGSSHGGGTQVAYLAGLLLTRGIGVDRDRTRGMALLEQAAEEQGEAAYELGRLYGDRYTDSLNDISKSIAWYERAVALGQTKAYVDLAYGYYNHNNDNDKERIAAATRYATLGAEQSNDRFCQYILGHLAAVEEDNTDKAIEWLTQSAQQDFAVAIEELASIYMKKQAYKDALHWCTKGSDIPFCQTALGDMYRNGWGVDRDYQKAFQYYQTAASQPEAPNHYAQHMLGEM